MEAQATLQFRVSGINLQDLQDFCRFGGKEIFNVNSRKCLDCSILLGMRSAQKFSKNQIQIFQID